MSQLTRLKNTFGIPYVPKTKKISLGTQKQYFAEETLQYNSQMSEYSPNYEAVEILEYGSNIKKVYNVRVEDTIEPSTGIHKGDDWKEIVFHNGTPKVTLGMKAFMFGSTWLGVNTNNLASVIISIGLRRCNNVLKKLDEWGNLLCEPFIFEKYVVNNSTNISKPSDPETLGNGDIPAHIQHNEKSKYMIVDGNRFIVDGKAWRVRGSGLAQRQETDNPNSVCLETFYLFYDQIQEDDDLVNGIANAGTIKWTIDSNIKEITARIGQEGIIETPIFLNGNRRSDVKCLYKSSNDKVVTINQTTGEYTTVGLGNAEIYCIFEKNTNILLALPVEVKADVISNFSVRIDPIVKKIRQYESVILNGYLFNYDKGLGGTVEFLFSGVSEEKYSTKIISNNSIQINCIEPDYEYPLIVTCKAIKDNAEYSASIEIALADTWG
ncbi:MAG: hypothetical protein AB9836_04490 [Aminipila sp.]